MALRGCPPCSAYFPTALPPISSTEMFGFRSEFSLDKSEFRHVNASRFPSDTLQGGSISMAGRCVLLLQDELWPASLWLGKSRADPCSGQCRLLLWPLLVRALGHCWALAIASPCSGHCWALLWPLLGPSLGIVRSHIPRLLCCHMQKRQRAPRRRLGIIPCCSLSAWSPVLLPPASVRASVLTSVGVGSALQCHITF